MREHDDRRWVPTVTGRVAAMLAVVLAATVVAAEVPDPTAPPAALRVAARPAPSARRDDLELQSVLTGAGRRVAIVDGRTVREGDRIGDLRVARIEPRRVVLDRQDPVEQVVLSLADVAVRSAPVAAAEDR